MDGSGPLKNSETWSIISVALAVNACSIWSMNANFRALINDQTYTRRWRKLRESVPTRHAIKKQKTKKMRKKGKKKTEIQPCVHETTTLGRHCMSYWPWLQALPLGTMDELVAVLPMHGHNESSIMHGRRKQSCPILRFRWSIYLVVVVDMCHKFSFSFAMWTYSNTPACITNNIGTLICRNCQCVKKKSVM